MNGLTERGGDTYSSRDISSSSTCTPFVFLPLGRCAGIFRSGYSISHLGKETESEKETNGGELVGTQRGTGS